MPITATATPTPGAKKFAGAVRLGIMDAKTMFNAHEARGEHTA